MELVSHAQSAIWYAEESMHDDVGYMTAQYVEICGVCDISLLRKAISLAIDEAEVLGKSFAEHDGDLYQFDCVSNNEIDVLYDVAADNCAGLAGWVEGKLKVAALSWRNSVHAQFLVRFGETKIVWFSLVHHIAFDAFAFSLLQQRTEEHYKALLMSHGVRPPWFGRIVDVLDEQKHYQQSSDYYVDRVFWLNYYSGAPLPVTLAGTYVAPSSNIVRLECSLLPELSVKIFRLGQSRSASFVDVLIAIFNTYLARACETDDPVVGITMMGRLGSAALTLPINHTNVLPLRVGGVRQQTFFEWIERAKSNLRLIRKHTRYRGEWLAREVTRTANHQPLVATEINILPLAKPLVLGNARGYVHHFATGPVRDLTITCYTDEASQKLWLRFDANANLYNAGQLQEHLLRLLNWMAVLLAQPNKPVSSLELVTYEERARIARWNMTGHPVEETDLATLFERQVARTPSRTALIFGNQELDYATLARRVRRLASLIRQRLPTNCGEPIIAIAMERSLELEIALLAVHKAGAAYMPLPAGYPALRIAAMLERADAKLIITTIDRVQDFYGTKEILCIDDVRDRLLSDSTLDFMPLSSGDPQKPAYLLFTSGSTGEPKGVLVEQRAIVNRLLWMQHRYPLTANDRVLQKTPYGFDVSVWEFFWPLIAGATLVMAPPGIHHDPHELDRLIRRQRITTLHFVPSMLSRYLDELDRQSSSLNNVDPLYLRSIFSSGEALRPELANRCKQLIDVKLINLYGPTEAAVDVTHWEVPDSETISTPIGRPIWNTRIHILNEDLEPVPIGVVGELYISGRNLARGYIGQPELTNERFIYDSEGTRLYRSGDLARWTEAGVLEYHGRIDHQVKLRGLRIELDEISRVMERHPSVGEACVAVHEERLIAYVALRAEVATLSILLDHCRGQLPDYMIPQQIVELDRLPLNSSGKLDRKALPIPASLQNTVKATPASLDEQRMCELFAEVLKLEHCGPEDDFFALGGHSLNAVELAARVRETTGWEVTIATLFTSPTPRLLVKNGKQASTDDMLATTLLLRASQIKQGAFPTLFCFHPAGGISWCYGGLARYLKTPCEIVGLQAKGLFAGSSAASSMAEMARDYVAEMRRHQPEGPYYLLGWSVGGMIAHTVAAMLEAEDQQVALLGLMDAYPSDLWRFLLLEEQTPQEEETSALAALLFIAGISLPFEQELPSVLVPKGEVLAREDVIELLRRNGNALASLSDENLNRLINVVINSRRLVAGSTHLHFSGNALFFTAAKPRAEHWLTIDAWKPYIAGTITNVDVDCDHPGMARPEAMALIAEHLDQAILASMYSPVAATEEMERRA